MPTPKSRRTFLRDLGIGTATLPFICNLPSLGFANQNARKQRLVIIFSPNGIVPTNFWPDEEGDKFTLKPILKPLEPFQDKTLVLKGVSDRIRGDGDGHMRGIGCLLTGIELFPGNIQGGSDTPAGWSSGISIDQEIKNYLQSKETTRTRFGSLEFGAMVPDRADPWTRMVYAGPNKPVAPIDDPYQMFQKLYGRAKNQEHLKSILDDLREDLKVVENSVAAEDRHLLEAHATLVREMETELASAKNDTVGHPVPALEPGLKQENDNLPRISKTQIDLMVASLAADFTRVATYQITNSVGEPRMKWLGIDKGHHAISHEPDSNKEAVEQLTKINAWYCEQVAYLAKRLAETPEPGGNGTLLDNTLIIWTNELGQGNSHTLDNIPFILVGNGLDFKMGRSLRFDRQPHNRLLIAIANGFGHEIKTFGNPDFCAKGPLTGLHG